MKKLMFLSLIVICSGLTIAQKATIRKYSIRGVVIDVKNIPVPYANVLLYSGTDSVTTKGTTSDEQGNFEVGESEGLYSRSEYQFRSRQFLLTLTFRLNKDANGKGNEEREENGNDPEI